MRGLKGKTALVTGATGVLGRAIVRRLSEEGARVVAASRTKERAAALKKELRIPGLVALELDLGNEASIKLAFDELASAKRLPSILVANASSREGLPKSVAEHTIAKFTALFGVDVAGHFLCAREMVDRLKGKPASIVVLSSVYALAGVDHSIYPAGMSPAPANYAAVKAGAVGLTRYLAGLWGSRGVRVNAVAPGGVAAPGRQPEAFVKNYCRKTMLGRMAERDEIASAVAFLASDEASYITGECLAVDGGLSAW